MNENNDILDEVEDENNESDQLNLKSFENTSTYNVDLTVDMIINYYERNKFVFEPDFQRRNVWDLKKKSKFIESIILNIPIPSILLADDKKRNEYIIIDGKQRLSTIVEFFAPKNGKKGFKLKGLEILSSLNGYDYYMLYNDAEKIELLSQLQTYPLKASIVKNYNEKLLYFVFARLNSGSVALSTQELRYTLYPGEFSKFINENSKNNSQIRRILNLKDIDERMKDAELLCRFYAFKYFLDKYDNTVGALLDYTYETINKNWDDWHDIVNSDLIEFNKSVDLIYKIFDKNAFKVFFPDKKEYGNMNRLVFDILATFFSVERNRNLIMSRTEEFKNFFEGLFTDKNSFIEAFKPVTSSKEKTQTRFSIFTEEFYKEFDR